MVGIVVWKEAIWKKVRDGGADSFVVVVRLGVGVGKRESGNERRKMWSKDNYRRELNNSKN